MMQTPALQDKLCLKFLLVIVPEVLLICLGTEAEVNSQASIRDTYVTKPTFLYCESNR
jgi:hypothetical protein